MSGFIWMEKPHAEDNTRRKEGARSGANPHRGKERGRRPMKIAILGARGIPARYSGYDTLAEELTLRLVQSGEAEVLVYCRSAYFPDRPKSLHGARLIYLPAPRLKALESLVHSFLSSIHVLGQNADLVYFLDPANAPFCVLLRLLGKKVVVHTDGLGWKRRKWGRLARRYYKLVEWVCARAANALITDNPAMKQYYQEEYGADSTCIAYGATNLYGVDESACSELGIQQKNYLLVVARLEPENNTDLIISEYVRSSVDMPLVVVGDSPYGRRYMERLRQLADQRVRFLGRIDDQSKVNALYRGAYVYIHGHEVGGTNPSLLRAMNAGTAPLAIDVPFNRAVLGSSGSVFSKVEGDLCGKLEHLVANADEVRKSGELAKAYVEKHFTWDSVASEHIKLFLRVAGQK